jgi:hypothetical protein
MQDNYDTYMVLGAWWVVLVGCGLAGRHARKAANATPGPAAKSKEPLWDSGDLKPFSRAALT